MKCGWATGHGYGHSIDEVNASARLTKACVRWRSSMDACFFTARTGLASDTDFSREEGTKGDEEDRECGNHHLPTVSSGAVGVGVV